MEEILKEKGFESEKEFHQMVTDVILSDIDKTNLFFEWIKKDGTKNGLLKLVGNKKPGLINQAFVCYYGQINTFCVK